MMTRQYNRQSWVLETGVELSAKGSIDVFHHAEKEVGKKFGVLPFLSLQLSILRGRQVKWYLHYRGTTSQLRLRRETSPMSSGVGHVLLAEQSYLLPPNKVADPSLNERLICLSG